MKKTIKTLLIWLSSVLHRDTSPKVVFYHDIGQAYTPMGTPESLFWLHMAYLKTKVEDEGGGGQRNVRHHEVAFDDGFRGVWDNRELLRKHDIQPIVFIAIDLVGQPGYLTWDEIRTLQNDYGFNFQCHTWLHQTLIGPVNTDLPIPSDPNFRTDAWYHHELVDSRTELERQLNKKIDALCFPVGYFSDDVIDRCRVAGYAKLYASFPGNRNDVGSVIPRCLCQDLSLFEFRCVLSGGMNGLQSRYKGHHYVH